MPDSLEADTMAAEAGENSLAARLLAPDTFEYLISDSKALIHSEIKKKSMTVRTAVKLVTKIKPDIIDRTVRELMPQFVHAIEPHYAAYQAQTQYDLRDYLLAHESEVAEAVLGVADRRAGKIHNRAIRSAYDRIRGRAHREIVAAMPGIATTIAKHA